MSSERKLLSGHAFLCLLGASPVGNLVQNQKRLFSATQATNPVLLEHLFHIFCKRRCIIFFLYESTSFFRFDTVITFSNSIYDYEHAFPRKKNIRIPAGHNYFLTVDEGGNCISFSLRSFLEKEKREGENLQKMKLLPILIGSSGIFASNGTTEAPVGSFEVEKPCDGESFGAAAEIKLANETEVEEIQLVLDGFNLKAAKEREANILFRKYF